MTRPSPAAGGGCGPVTAVILAAGHSRRMGQRNKLLLPIGDTPMIQQVALAVLASRADPVIVVTGFEGVAVRAALAGLKLVLADNPCPDKGLSSSLRIGLSALPADCAATLVCLGDMPRVGAVHIDALVAAFQQHGEEPICVPTYGGRRGNPVLWPTRLFGEIKALTGDAGARALLARYADQVLAVAMADSAVLVDVDTPGCLGQLGTPTDAV
ncbi:MAG: nucleotidyltransferase family protein [Arenicellales bacterium]|nr:nucleotidyltransferase family protein [Arenicellales bacterium]MDP6313264.1 nucleotidyltransferase family protein [Arenicellales bacterium]MDP7120044.1 nucleotidyltransferase family protein [Arenicellales bacterium]MDP7193126.1 nucleotidyltransferase family protein [Arenicellales bacterium]MDP7490987.1 nucleotidyltransferase family protein [Arenicellales bacterium]